MFFFTNISSFSVDCPSVVTLASNLGMNKGSTRNLYNSIVSNCCTSSGITCDANERVVSIVWNAKSLNGTLNGSILPDKLESLYLEDNSIIGELPISYPDTLKGIYLQNNLITGVLNMSSFSTNMTEIYLTQNSLTGSVPNFSHMVYLTALGVDKNSLNGTLGEFAPNLIGFYAGTNNLVGSIPSLPITLQKLYLELNSLSGNMASIPASLKDLSIGWTVGLNLNRISGSVILNAPVNILIRSNLISDIQVISTSKLTFCDISNNPLLNNPNLSNLNSKCNTTALYHYVPPSITSTAEKTNLQTSTLVFAMATTTQSQFQASSDIVIQSASHIRASSDMETQIYTTSMPEHPTITDVLTSSTTLTHPSTIDAFRTTMDVASISDDSTNSYTLESTLELLKTTSTETSSVKLQTSLKTSKLEITRKINRLSTNNPSVITFTSMQSSSIKKHVYQTSISQNLESTLEFLNQPNSFTVVSSISYSSGSRFLISALLLQYVLLRAFQNFKKIRNGKRVSRIGVTLESM